MTGVLEINADGGLYDPVGAGINGALRVSTSNTSGVAAYVSSESAAPTLAVKNGGTGPIMFALNGNTLKGLEVTNEGHVFVGTQGSPVITLDATSGNITLDGAVFSLGGDRLTPVAYGTVEIGGTLGSGTSNISAVREIATGRYEVDFTGFSFTSDPVITATSVNVSPADQIVTWGIGDSNTLRLNVADGSGAGTLGNVSFVIHAE